MKMLKMSSMLAMLLLPMGAMAEDLDITRDMDADGTVSVSNISGTIEISTWNRAQVKLTGYTGRNQELQVVESANGISFKVENIDDKQDSDESEVILVIPEGASIVAAGVSADVTIKNSSGASVTADSVSGDVEVEAESDRVEIKSVSGDVTFNGETSRMTAESVSGDIELNGVSGELNVQTVSGDAEVDAGEVTHGKFESVSGTIEVSLSAADGGRLVVSNMSGDVILNLPSSQSASFNAQSFSGDISSDFGSVKSERFGPGSSLKHNEGNSGTTIRLETFSGDIDIRNR